MFLVPRRQQQNPSVVSVGGRRGPEELTGSQFKTPQGTDIWAPQPVHTEHSIWWPNRKVIQSHLPNKQEFCGWRDEWGHLQAPLHKGIGRQLPIASGPSCLYRNPARGYKITNMMHISFEKALPDSSPAYCLWLSTTTC